MREIEIELEGRVQGIGLRQIIKTYALKKGINGYVLNKEEGSVIIVAQADGEKIKELLEWLYSAPGFARIDKLTYNWRESNVQYESFKIISEKNFIQQQTSNFINLGKSFFKKNISVPEHISIIPDGNRRWAKEKGFVSSYGHYKAGSYNNFKSLIKEAEKSGVKYMSFWGFSTENWKRDEKERNALFELLIHNIKLFDKDAKSDRIRVRHIGRKDRLPKELADSLQKLEAKTRNNKGISVQLCLDYGGKDEIIRAVNRLLKVGVSKVDEDDFSMVLDTNNIPDPDLIIRTSGEQRTSGFMPFQSAYAELYFTDKYFPDFDVKELRKAIEEFSRRKRRFGG